jgi:hypothetical protein
MLTAYIITPVQSTIQAMERIFIIRRSLVVMSKMLNSRDISAYFSQEKPLGILRIYISVAAEEVKSITGF